MAKLKTSVKRAGALTTAQSRHASGMLDALARCASLSQDAVAVERPEAASVVAVNAADEVRLSSVLHSLGGACISAMPELTYMQGSLRPPGAVRLEHFNINHEQLRNEYQRVDIA